MLIFKEFRFEAAHWLPHVPEGHKCRRLHGHSYRVELRVEGPIDADLGWVADFGDLGEAFEPLRRQLDHRCLNEIEGLENPTCEVLAVWLWRRLAAALPGLAEIEVRETARSGCVYRGEAESR